MNKLLLLPSPIRPPTYNYRRVLRRSRRFSSTRATTSPPARGGTTWLGARGDPQLATAREAIGAIFLEFHVNCWAWILARTHHRTLLAAPFLL